MEIYKFIHTDETGYGEERCIKGEHFLDCVEQLCKTRLHEVKQINITILYDSEGHYAYVDIVGKMELKAIRPSIMRIEFLLRNNWGRFRKGAE